MWSMVILVKKEISINCEVNRYDGKYSISYTVQYGHIFVPHCIAPTICRSIVTFLSKGHGSKIFHMIVSLFCTLY